MNKTGSKNFKKNSYLSLIKTLIYKVGGVE